MNNYRDPGYRFFEPSEMVECVECHEIVNDEFATVGAQGEVVCSKCMLDLVF